MHGHLVIHGGVMAAAAARSLPLVISLHGSDVYVAERHGIAGRAAGWAFDRAAWTTACSDDLHRRAVALGASLLAPSDVARVVVGSGVAPGGRRTFLTQWNAFNANAEYINQAPYGMLLRLFTSNVYTQPLVDASWLVTPLRVVMIVGAALWWMRVVPRRGTTDGAVALSECLLALPLTLIFSPLAEDIHYCALLPALVGLSYLAWSHGLARQPATWILWATFTFFCIPRMQEIVLPDCPPPHFALGHSAGATVLLRAAHRGKRWFDRIVLTSPMIQLAEQPMLGLAGPVARTLHTLGFGALYVPGGGPAIAALQPFPGNIVTSDPVRYTRSASIIEADRDLGLGAPTIAWADAALRAMAEFARPTFPAEIRQPILIIAAGRDQLTSTKVTEIASIQLRA